MTDVRTLCANELRSRPPAAIVIGGSAGGIEALKVLLPAFPGETSAPVLVVVHVAPDTKSQWSMVFADSKLPVREAEDKDVAERGAIYFAPPNYHLLVAAGGRLSLSLDARVNYARPAIDVLFESAAHAYQHRLLGIVLSGANADGAAGLDQIARAGGHAWVQAPHTAVAPFMPQSALSAVRSARVLSPDHMAHVFQSGALSSPPLRGPHA